MMHLLSKVLFSFVGFSYAVQNTILLIPDGGGPSVFTLAREMGNSLYLDQHLVGTTRTKPATTLITDSAAAATALSSGYKTSLTKIGVTSDDTKVASILEAAKRKGMVTGVITTSRITDATPAGFLTHTARRGSETAILRQIIHSPYPVDFILGGGKGHFTSELKQDILDRNYKIGMTEKEFKKYVEETEGEDPRFYGLFANFDMEFEMDRLDLAPEQPSLHTMVEGMLKLLKASPTAKKHGYLIMIESNNIDVEMHNDDAAAAVVEVLHYDKVAQMVIENIDEKTTSVVAVADHETGGLSLGSIVEEHRRGIYKKKGANYYNLYPYDFTPSKLAIQKMSTYAISKKVTSYLFAEKAKLSDQNNEKEKKRIIKEGQKMLLPLVQANTAIQSIREDDKQNLRILMEQCYSGDKMYCWYMRVKLGQMIGTYAGVAYGSAGHTGTDVLLYCYGSITEKCRGYHDNTEIPKIIAKHLGLENDMEEVTKELGETPLEKAAEDAEAGMIKIRVRRRLS